MVCSVSVRDQYAFNESMTSMHESLKKCLWPEVGRLQPFFANKLLLEHRNTLLSMIYGCFHAMMLELSSCDRLYSLQSLVRKHMLTLVPGDRVSIVDGFLRLLFKFVKGLVGGVMSLASTPVYLKHGHLLRAPDQTKKFEQSLETCFLL